MRDCIYGKVVYFNKDKTWSDERGNFVERLIDASVYSWETEDKFIVEEFDDDLIDQIEIWKIRKTIETT